MSKPKILFIAQEIHPYLPHSAMADFGVGLPVAIQEHGFEVRTFMPKYGMINERRNQLHEVIRLSGLNISIDDTDHPLIIKVATLQPSRMQVYFIDNDDYFQHSTKDLETNLTPEENDERCIFFARGIIETVKKLRWEPAVVHIVGWLGALTPLYLKEMYGSEPTFKTSKIVYSLYDYPLPDKLDEKMVEKLRFDGFNDEKIQSLIQARDIIALNRIAIDYADGIVESSENIPAEIIDYAIASGKPFLRLPQGDDSAAQYVEFYKSLQD